MKSPRFWLLVIGLIIGVLAIRPTGELWIRTEVAKRTGTQLSMDRCQFNMLTGSVAIEGAVIERCAEGTRDEDWPQTPIKIAKIWSKSSLNKLLYRKVSAPITVMDGIEFELSKIDENQVPSVHPVTPLVRNSTLLLAPQTSPFLDELDRVYQTAQNAIHQDRSTYDGIGQQIEQIEGHSLQFDNPLRDRDGILAAQQSVASLMRELDRARGSLDEHRESFQKASLAIINSTPQDHAISHPSSQLASDEELAEIKMQARSLIEYLVCSTVARAKPYLGFSATITRQCLLDGCGCKSHSPSRTGPIQKDSDRGVNYGFGSMNESDMVFRSVRMRGAAMIDELLLPFNGQMKNIGNQGLCAEARPALSLMFASQENRDFESPTVSLQSSVIPDHQGFQMQSQMVPKGSMIASIAQGDWKLAAFGQESKIIIVWLVHQSEWSLSVDIHSSQSEVVVKRSALLSAPVQMDMMPRFESCFEAEAPVSLAKAQFQGNIENGIPLQRTLLFESPFLDGLAQSMMEQQQMMLDVGNVSDRKKSLEAFDQSFSSYKSKIDETHRAVAGMHEAFSTRLRRAESKIAEALPNRDDFRFSREDADSILR